ncbi:MAG: hypothetical protein IPM70_02385 [Proteobacteria bacterium]|nr:hypothetical protein [Pseudomonadota bacterium]
MRQLVFIDLVRDMPDLRIDLGLVDVFLGLQVGVALEHDGLEGARGHGLFDLDLLAGLRADGRDPGPFVGRIELGVWLRQIHLQRGIWRRLGQFLLRHGRFRLRLRLWFRFRLRFVHRLGDGGQGLRQDRVVRVFQCRHRGGARGRKPVLELPLRVFPQRQQRIEHAVAAAAAHIALAHAQVHGGDRQVQLCSWGRW